MWVAGAAFALAAWAGAEAEGVASVGYAMRRVPAGRYEVGSPPDAVDRSDDEVLHAVVVTHALWVGATEVTQGQYRAVVGVNPSHFSECGASCPVEQVSWRDAVAFANALSAREGLDPCYLVTDGSVAWPQGVQCTGYRLPTEAEWEVAARGGGTGVYAGGDAVEAVAWTAFADGSRTHPVGQKAPNGYGLFDMSGNVAEWTWDRYAAYPTTSVTDPTGPAEGAWRVVRGGAWCTSNALARVASRYFLDPSSRRHGVGFRLVRTIP